MSKLSLSVQTPGKNAVAALRTPAQAKELETLAAAAKRYAESLEQRNVAAEVQLRAGRTGGQMLIEMADSGQRARNRNRQGSESPPVTLADLGIEPMRSSRWQWLARLPEARFESYLAETIAAAEPITASGLSAHVGNNSGENEWYTPEPYITAARAVMGGIDLDPASNADANAVVKAETYCTPENSGLDQPWNGRVWMNPPYAQPLIWMFSEKLSDEVAHGNVEQATVLVNNATETAWFQRMCEVAAAICFPSGRVKFWHPERRSATPLQGQAVLYFGPNVEAFRSEFLQFGVTVVL